MPEPHPAPGTVSLSAARRHDRICDRFEAAWRAGAPPQIEDLLAEVPSGERPALFAELLRLEREFRGADCRPDEYHARFPNFAPLIDTAFRATAPTLPPADRPPDAPLPAVPGYELLGEVGGGGMGVVYRARHLGLGQLVALKMLRSGPWSRPDELARFRREANEVFGLTHPNIVRLYEFDEWRAEGGGPPVPYFTMEYVAGGSLAERLRAGPLPPRVAAALVETLARAMHYVHERRVIHRDLKPGNVLLAGDTPKVADFGLVKRLDGAEGLTTRHSVVLGTPCYMAPEQARGEKPLTPAVDVYALGAVLYECLTAQPPFRGDTHALVIYQVLTDEPVPPRRLRPEVPADLEAVCLKCLEKEPAQRYPSAAALADDLRRILDGESPVGPLNVVEQHERWAQRVGYELIEPIGCSRWAFAYKARRLNSLGRVVTFMVAVQAGPGDDPAARFRRQGQTMDRLDHPHVVRLHDFGESAGLPYLVLEHVDGGSLTDQFRTAAGSPGQAVADTADDEAVAVARLVTRSAHAPTAPRRAAELIEALARAVQHLHERGVVHGAVHPSAVLLTAAGVPKLGGFTVARLLDRLAAETSVPAYADVIPPHYLAPEQLAGPWAHPGPATDVYGLGAVLYELLAGEPPFLAETLQETRDWALDRPPDPPGAKADVPADLEAVCLRCLEKDPARRYRSAAALADDLRRFLTGAPESPRPSFTGFADLQPLEGGDDFVSYYRAREVRTGRAACLKVFAGLVTAADMDRFQRTAYSRLDRWRHPHVVELYAAGTRGGSVYLAHEWLPGGSLRQRVGRRPRPPAEAAGLVETLARALAAAHERGLIHGNLEPANVLFAADGTPKVAELGLVNQPAGPAELARRPDDAGRTLAAGDVFRFVGDVRYLAPEVVAGDAARIGPATDVYGLGTVLYHLLTGRPPFEGDTLAATADRVRFEAATPPGWHAPGVPPALEAVCLRCLAKDPARRYRSAAALADDLRRFLEAPPAPDADEGTVDIPPGGAPVPAVSPIHLHGEAVPGYEVLAEFARGRTATVYRARQRSTGQVVALKVLPTARPGSARGVALLRHEAHVLGELDHPNVVRVYDCGEAEGLAYLVTEFVDGLTLKLHTLGQPQPVAPAAALVEELARAAAHVHKRGIVHRDLKPANVLLAPSDDEEGRHYGVPKLTDFGLALRLRDRSGAPGPPGAVVGTPSYMAPEQAAGAEVGPEADLWSLGAILYELLTGRPPFLGADVMETLELVRTAEVVPPRALRPEAPAELEVVCLRCLSRDPAGRFAAAAELAKALRRFLDGCAPPP
jgi:serine/threonine protein kinase